MSSNNGLRRHSALNVQPELGSTFIPYSDYAKAAGTLVRPNPQPQHPRSRQPNKLQKQRKGAVPPYHQAPRRHVSFDLSTLSDTSTRALIDGRISIARYGQYTTPFIHRAVLKKNRDRRAVTTYHHPMSILPNTRRSPFDPLLGVYPQTTRPHQAQEEQQPISPPLPPLPLDRQWYPDQGRRHPSVPAEEASSLLNNISHKSSSLMSASWPQLPHGDQLLNHYNEGPSSLEAHTRLHTQLHDQVSSNKQQRYSMPHVFPPLNVDKPLPPKPSALIEEFSPTTLHRRWTITSHPSTHGSSNSDILLDDSGLTRSQEPSSFSAIPVPPTPTAAPDIIEERRQGPCPEVNPKLHALTINFIDTQRSYVETLRKTVANDADTPPVDLLLSFLSVIEVSEEFLRRMQLDSSPLGIANAFLHTCGKLENHLLQWSNEVNKFVQSTQPAQIQVSVRPDRPYRHPVGTTQRKGLARSQKESFIVSFFRRKAPSKGRHGSNTVTPDTLWQRSSSGPGLWEMAVLPTQRTMRYAFLFKEILSLLDASDTARPATDRAFHAATCIAQKMTRAQQQPSLYFV